MTRLIALTQTAHPAPAAFNADFYITAATVIPVLFLAVAVQGDTWAELLRTVRSLGQKPAAAAGLAFMGTYVLAVLILLLGASGEIEAVAALYTRAARSTQPQVLAALVALTLLTAFGPALAFIRAATGKHPDQAPALATNPQAGPGATA